jgi:CBS domain-containing protein
VPATADLSVALKLLTESSFHQAPVLDDNGTVLGMVTRADILRFLQYRDEVGLRGAAKQDVAPRPV